MFKASWNFALASSYFSSLYNMQPYEITYSAESGGSCEMRDLAWEISSNSY